jgi:hypothetical protein
MPLLEHVRVLFLYSLPTVKFVHLLAQPQYSYFAPHLSDAEIKILKDLQDLSRNIWAGAGAVLAIIYFGQH